MTRFENAANFFHACEGLQGWAGCEPFVAPGAVFDSQCEPLAEIRTVQQYTEWMAGLGRQILPGCRYELHTASYDQATHMAMFFATLTATHTGAGGPVPATHRTTRAHYVYVLTMNEQSKVSRMTKIWNAPWTLRELGWA